MGKHYLLHVLASLYHLVTHNQSVSLPLSQSVSLLLSHLVSLSFSQFINKLGCAGVKLCVELEFF